MSEGESLLCFEYEPVGGNGKVQVTVKLGDEVLALDKVDVLSASARERFTKSTCEGRPAIDREQVKAELLAIAKEVQERSKPDGGEAQGSEEIDVSNVVRPERFITPFVSGLTVAIPALREGRPAGRWMLYLKWADGGREGVVLTESIALPNEAKLWIYPTPGDPSVRETPAWVEPARKAWLAGAVEPDPADVFKRLCQCIAYFIDFPSEHAEGTTATLALWVVLTYCYPAWSAIPYLYLGGPAGSGKTRVFEVLSRLVFRPLQSSSLSAAALFRTLDSRGGTLLYDEAERLKDATPDISEINAMLLAGYKRGGRATRMEPVGDTYRPVEFDVFGPKALACIRGLPPALSSRCITVMMFRAGMDSQKPRRRIDAYLDRWQALRADLCAMALEHGPTFLELAGRGDVCPAMSGREYELWQPLLALAAWIEECGASGLLRLIQDRAAASIESSRDEQMPEGDEVLLRALAKLIQAGSSPIAKEVLEAACEEDRQMFDRWTAKGVANALRRYSVETRKTHGRRTYGQITTADLCRVQKAYNMDLGLHDDDPGNVPHVPQVPQQRTEQGQQAPS